MRLRRWLSICCLAGCPTIGLAQPAGIIQIYLQFNAGREAATLCGAVNQNTDRLYFANLTNVSIRAAQAYKQRFPSWTDEQLAAGMKSDAEKVHQRVQADIKQNGCSTERVQNVLKLYKVQSEHPL